MSQNRSATPTTATPTTASFHHDLRAAGPDDERAVARFLELKARIRELKEELDELKPRVTALVMDQPDEMTATFEGAALKVYYRTYYDYSDVVDELNEQLKATKSYERAHGIATIRKQRAVLQVRL